MDLFFSSDGFTVFSLHILIFGILFAVVFDAYCSYVIRKRLNQRIEELERERKDMQLWSVSIYDYLQDLRKRW